MDKELEFMRNLSNDQLKLFVDTMLEKGDLTEDLTSSEEYRTYGSDYTKYVDRIMQEYIDFGSNTLTKYLVGENSYKEILISVAEKLKVNFNEDQSVETIESHLLEKVLMEAWEKMTDEEKRELLDTIRDKHGTPIDLTAEGSTALLWAFRYGGFASYKLSLIVVNAVAKAILGRGLSLGLNAALTKSLSIIVGPIGIAITTLWTALDIAGPAYRVIIPCTVLIAAYRHEYELRKYRPAMEALLSAPSPATVQPLVAEAEDEEDVSIPADKVFARLRVAVNGAVFTASLVDNESARTLAAHLPATLIMQELNGNSKYVSLLSELPTNPKRLEKIHAGDILLSDTDCIMLFYKKAEAPYRYTFLGCINDPVGLAAAAGSDRAKVELSLIK